LLYEFCISEFTTQGRYKHSSENCGGFGFIREEAKNPDQKDKPIYSSGQWRREIRK
jgi:hypothetical protein